MRRPEEGDWWRFDYHPDPSTALVLPDEARAWVPADVADKKALMDLLASQLPFQESPRNNWDTLSDLLSSPDGLGFDPIVLVHEDLPGRLPRADRQNYVCVLADALETQEWTDRRRADKLRAGVPRRGAQWPGEDRLRQLRVVFPARARAEIAALLANRGSILPPDA